MNVVVEFSKGADTAAGLARLEALGFVVRRRLLRAVAGSYVGPVEALEGADVEYAREEGYYHLTATGKAALA